MICLVSSFGYKTIKTMRMKQVLSKQWFYTILLCSIFALFCCGGEDYGEEGKEILSFEIYNSSDQLVFARVVTCNKSDGGVVSKMTPNLYIPIESKDSLTITLLRQQLYIYNYKVFFYKPATMIAIAENRNLTHESDGAYRDDHRRMYENDQDCDSCVIVKTWDFILERKGVIEYK
jgi:hypothetical protein